jgi:hypothetical protein
MVNDDVFGCEVVRDAFVTEISILSPDRRPKEPLARVVGLWKEEAKPERSAGTLVPAREIPPASPQRPEAARASRGCWETPSGQDAELRRRLEAADWADGGFEVILEQMRTSSTCTSTACPG